MENDPFYSDYDDDAFYCLRFDNCEIAIDSSASSFAEVKVPVGRSNVVQKYVDYINNDENEVHAEMKYVETKNDKELWHVEADKDIIGITMEFYDFCIWRD